MSIETVNGYVCTNCTEAAQAKRGIDPHQGPSQPGPAAGHTQATTQDQRPRAALAYLRNLDQLA